MKLILVCLLCWFTSIAHAQITTLPIPGAPGIYVTVGQGANALPLANLANNPAAVNITMADDDNRLVPLGFSFPYFGQTFSQSWMHSNGVLSFQNPQVTGNFCCAGNNLVTTTGSGFNYTIMPLWTDLIGSGTNNHFYLPGNNEITYGWYNVNEYGTQNSNSFELKLNSAGLVDVRLSGALVSIGRAVTSGMSGNLAAGEYVQFYHGSGWNTANPMTWQALSGTSLETACIANPLTSPTCSGYAQAYLTQQCTITALFDPQCPGYQQALFTQQCSINSLYDPQCPGYTQAYFNQQCTMNPLYDSTCPEYQQAFFSKQCELNPLYDSKCSGYSAAYATKMLFEKQESNTTTTAQTAVATAKPTSDNTPTTTAVSAAAPAAPVQLVPSTNNVNQTTGAIAAQQTSSSSQSNAANQPKENTQTPTRAQQLQKARQEAARKEAAAKASSKMQEAKDAKSMEQQIATQDTILSAMGYNAAFDVYNTLTLKDAAFYRSVQIYPNSRPVDNQRALRGLSGTSEQKFNNMIDQQYK